MTKKGVSVSQSVTTTTKKGATHPRFFEKHICNGASAMCSHSSSCSSCSLFFLATSLHQTWHPVCPHQGLTGDSCPSKEEAYLMHTMRTSGKRCYKVVNVSACFMQINLFAPDLAPSMSTPRAHWRQQVFLGRGLFHVHCMCTTCGPQGWIIRYLHTADLTLLVRACTDLHTYASTRRWQTGEEHMIVC